VKFDTWFAAQFGNCPMAHEKREALDRDYFAARTKFYSLESIRNQDDALIRKYDAAQKGWNCTDAYRKKAKP
jgi:hypothetical protein